MSMKNKSIVIFLICLSPVVMVGCEQVALFSAGVGLSEGIQALQDKAEAKKVELEVELDEQIAATEAAIAEHQALLDKLETTTDETERQQVETEIAIAKDAVTQIKDELKQTKEKLLYNEGFLTANQLVEEGIDKKWTSKNPNDVIDYLNWLGLAGVSVYGWFKRKKLLATENALDKSNQKYKAHKQAVERYRIEQSSDEQKKLYEMVGDERQKLNVT